MGALPALLEHGREPHQLMDCGKKVGVHMSRLDFMESVTVVLICRHTVDNPAPAAKRVRVTKDHPHVARTVGQHWPVAGSKGRCVEYYAAEHPSRK